MDIHTLWIKIVISIFLTSLPISLVEAEDGNAIGSSIRSAITEESLGYVKVRVVQNENVNDLTRDSDGIYILKVPTSLKIFDLLFQKEGYFDAHDLDIRNNRNKQKRPIIKMIPINEIGKFSPDEIQQTLEDAKQAIERGKRIKSKKLINSGKKNLRTLKESIDQRLEKNTEPFENELKKIKEQIK